jgi:hypothetical protein
MKIWGDGGEDMTQSRMVQLSAILKKALSVGVSEKEILDTAKKRVYGGVLCIPKSQAVQRKGR